MFESLQRRPILASGSGGQDQLGTPVGRKPRPGGCRQWCTTFSVSLGESVDRIQIRRCRAESSSFCGIGTASPLPGASRRRAQPSYKSAFPAGSTSTSVEADHGQRANPSGRSLPLPLPPGQQLWYVGNVVHSSCKVSRQRQAVQCIYTASCGEWRKREPRWLRRNAAARGPLPCRVRISWRAAAGGAPPCRWQTRP